MSLSRRLRVLQVFLTALFVPFLASPHAFCAESGSRYAITEEKAIHAILGEAGTSFEERLAIAHALRNRGSLQGVYGWKQAPTASEWQNAARAWNQAIDSVDSGTSGTSATDPTHGATHWLSDWDLKYCRPSLIAWRLAMVETAHIGKTHFYRRIK